jgi:hypothetical protein
MKFRLFFYLALVSLTLSACDRMDRLLGKDDGDTDSAVVPAPAPETPRYPLYRDNGGSANNDPEFRMYGEGLDPARGMELMVEYSTTSAGAHNVKAMHNGVIHAGEGKQWVRINTDTDGSGRWIMTFDGNGTARTVDLSGYSSIVFMVRLFNVNAGRAVLPEDQISLEVEDGDGNIATVPLQQVQGFDSNVFGWQALRIPVSTLGNLDLSKIKRPLGLTYGTLANQTPLIIDVDDVAWEQ